MCELRKPQDGLYSKIVAFLLVGGLFTFGLAFIINASDYDRGSFNHWVDADNDGFNTRAEVLINQALTVNGLKLLSTDGNKIVSGVWVCPYTGDVIMDPGKMDVDHVVPLEWAWNHGANVWSDGKREEFANDPINLFAVAADVNRSKGAKGPDDWLPPNLRFTTVYLYRFEEVGKKYGLTGCDFNNLIQEYQTKKKGINP